MIPVARPAVVPGADRRGGPRELVRCSVQADRHSMTAVIMAVLRSYHASGPRPCIFEDNLAHALVSPAECEAFERASLGLLESVDPALAASCTDREMSIQHAFRVGPGVGPLARARYVEDSLFEALAHGAHQYVIIGAGLDTLAFRRPDLQDQLQVIEIDHPATQAFKRARLANAGLVAPSNLYFAAADLERERLAIALDRTPYDPAAPTFFAWPGVTAYLTRQAIFETLRSIADLAAPGSRLVFDYLEPAAFAPDAPARVRFLIQRASEAGEPMLAGLDPGALASDLEHVGFHLVEDLGPREIQSRFLADVDGFRAVEYWHFAQVRC
jgi:methyltransferase (TIGR00027 family)